MFRWVLLLKLNLPLSPPKYLNLSQIFSRCVLIQHILGLPTLNLLGIFSVAFSPSACAHITFLTGSSLLALQIWPICAIVFLQCISIIFPFLGFGKTIEESISTQDLFLSENEIKGDFDLVNGLDFPPNQELHIYADNNLIQSSYNNFIQYTQKNSRPSVYTIPELDLRNNGIQQGSYSMVYNFHHKIVSNLKVDEISADRTEIKLVYAGSGITNGFIPAIQSVLNDTGVNAFDTNGVKKDIVLNFKNNNIYDIINAGLDGLRVGVITETLTYPTAFCASANGQNSQPTTFVPFDSRFEGSLDGWVRQQIQPVVQCILLNQ